MPLHQFTVHIAIGGTVRKRFLPTSVAFATMALLTFVAQPASAAQAACLSPDCVDRTGGILGGITGFFIGLLIGLVVAGVVALLAYRAGVKAAGDGRDLPEPPT
ncbi:MAG: hypothetical protein ABIO67_06320 [Mycobacteriales bacterium]